MGGDGYGEGLGKEGEYHLDMTYERKRKGVEKGVDEKREEQGRDYGDEVRG